jgi:hypothetical protein
MQVTAAILREERKIYTYVISRKVLRLRILITTKISSAMLTHLFSSRGYHPFMKKRRRSFTVSLYSFQCRPKSWETPMKFKEVSLLPPFYPLTLYILSLFSFISFSSNTMKRVAYIYFSWHNFDDGAAISASTEHYIYPCQLREDNVTPHSIAY